MTHVWIAYYTAQWLRSWVCPQEVPGSDPGASNFLVIHLSAVTGDFVADFRKNKKSALSTLGRRSTFLIFQKKWEFRKISIVIYGILINKILILKKLRRQKHSKLCQCTRNQADPSFLCSQAGGVTTVLVFCRKKKRNGLLPPGIEPWTFGIHTDHLTIEPKYHDTKLVHLSKWRHFLLFSHARQK